MFCSSCGKEILEGSKFCPSCGKATNGAQDATNAVSDPAKISRKENLDALKRHWMP